MSAREVIVSACVIGQRLLCQTSDTDNSLHGAHQDDYVRLLFPVHFIFFPSQYGVPILVHTIIASRIVTNRTVV